MRELHDLLIKIQDDIARDGKFDNVEMENAYTLLSSPDIALDDENVTGAAIKQIILGQNKLQLPTQTKSRVYLPPIIALHNHPVILKTTTDIDRAVSVSTLKHYLNSALIVGVVAGVGVVVGVLSGVIAAIAIPGGAAVATAIAGGALNAAIVAPVAGMAGAYIASTNTKTIEKALKADYKYISSYHNPFVITNKNRERLKAAGQSLAAKFKNLIGSDLGKELTSNPSPSKQQKLAALEKIKKIEDPSERKAMLEMATGKGSKGTNDPLYRFFSYQRWFTVANADRGTLKLANDALAETNNLIQKSSSKNEKASNSDVAIMQAILKKEAASGGAVPMQELPAVPTAEPAREPARSYPPVPAHEPVWSEQKTRVRM